MRKVIGTTELNINVSGVEVCIEVHVSKSLNAELLLGLQFLSDIEVTLNFKNKEMLVQTKKGNCIVICLIILCYKVIFMIFWVSISISGTYFSIMC